MLAVRRPIQGRNTGHDCPCALWQFLATSPGPEHEKWSVLCERFAYVLNVLRKLQTDSAFWASSPVYHIRFQPSSVFRNSRVLGAVGLVVVCHRLRYYSGCNSMDSNAPNPPLLSAIPCGKFVSRVARHHYSSTAVAAVLIVQPTTHEKLVICRIWMLIFLHET